ncbi:MAG: cellulase family glycosylhydrolase, partial [Planctomycetaceae bacterium]|nr:cellulase family glycosylhydrolase [Planctomycetaceae bacterium]
MRHYRWFPLLTAFAILGLAAFADRESAQADVAEFPPLFPFVISFDAPDNITNIASQIDVPAGQHGFVRVEDGHFVTDKGPIRFWGTNLCFTANFPTKEQADKLADRLARFGYNCVRLHHLDTGGNSIVSGQLTLTELDRQKLDALDYLIAALKKRGIYVNINLHVGRWLDDRDGFPYREQRPDFDKGVGNFEPRMIELQKKYARDLLTHVNPYTGLSYTQDPCVA